MPCHGYSIPASSCKVGGRLREIEGSVCSDCYACKGRYDFEIVQTALTRREASLEDPQWTEAMSLLIKGMKFFRWHDSGDIQSQKHLNMIFDVCENTPETKHWIPTREYKIVEDVLKKRSKPKNLALRLSAHMVDESGPIVLAKRLGCTISEVGTTKYTCPAPDQGNKCGDCRKCWGKTFNIIYHKH
jgi:hypothetical protein